MRTVCQTLPDISLGLGSLVGRIAFWKKLIPIVECGGGS